MHELAFTVYGEPAPQGSKTVASTKSGASFVREDNPATRPWRTAVTAAAAEAMNGNPPLLGPLQLDVAFVFARPRSHYRSGRNVGQLKASAPTYCAKRPDLDKLLRAIGDALTGTAVVDDAQVVQVVARKHYGSPAAHVTIRRLTQ